ncbi:MAG TPA: endonuclease/exonuclease/phosphatase family protein [Gaiellaceae bacterium]
MPLSIRTWNLFHGNAKPPERQAFLEQMVRLATSDSPDVLCLQELPVWALPELGRWSGMHAFGDVAQPPRLGPFPGNAALGHALTSWNHGLLRSAFTGQGIAILLEPGADVLAHETLVLNAPAFREAQSRSLGLGLVARLAWAKERRIVQAVRARFAAFGTALIANLHATGYGPDERLADAELLRAACFADGLAEPGDVCILAGDFNAKAGRSATLAELGERGWGFSPASEEGVDHVLVRGARVSPPAHWPPERRVVAGRLLSDHAPLDLKAAA